MKKKVCIMVPSLYGGGAERVAADLSKILSLKYEVSFITFINKDKSYEHCGNNIVLDVKVKRGLAKVFTIIRRIMKVRKIKKRIGFDVCISILDGANLINVLTGGKTIVSYHSNKSVADIHLFTKLLTRFCIKKADKVIAVSEFVRKDLIMNYGATVQKSATIYNMCDVPTIQKKAEIKLEGDVKEPFLVTIGNLRIAKGHWHLIKAFAEVKKKISNLELYIVGEGELRSELEEIAQKMNVCDSVHFIGYMDNPFPLVRKADLFVFSSIYEGFGNVLVEALACKKMVISADCIAGPREILNPSNIDIKLCDAIYEGDYGILVPAFSAELEVDASKTLSIPEKLFAEAIYRGMVDVELRKKYEERANLRANNFSLYNVSLKWFEVLEEFMND